MNQGVPRLLRLLLCALLLVVTGTPAWAHCQSETRVGGSADFLPNFTTADDAKPIAASGENDGCGYDFASGLHKYPYVKDNPINRFDFSGLYTELTTFPPAGHLRSSFGHTALNVNGTAYSFDEKGWFQHQFEDYMARNTLSRPAMGQVLDLSAEQEAVLIKSINTSMAQNPAWTTTVNCASMARAMLDEATDGGLQADPPTPFPMDLFKLLNTKKVVININYYSQAPQPITVESSTSFQIIGDSLSLDIWIF